MPKVKCTCEKGFHSNQSQRLKCRTSRGQINRNGSKRFQCVIIEKNIQSYDVERCSEIKQMEEQITESNNSFALELSQPNKQIEIVSNYSLLRTGYRKIKCNLNQIRNRNYSRMVKDTDDITPNILQMLEEKQNRYDSNPFRRKKNIRKFHIQISEERDSILYKLYKYCSKQWEKYPVTKEDQHIGSSFNQIQEFVEKKKKNQDLYSKEWQKHFQRIRKGKFQKFNVKLYHIEELVQQGEWDKIIDMEKKYEQIEELWSLGLQQREKLIEKKFFFEEFTRETFKQVEVLLYLWKKKITRLEDGTIVKFERIKLCPINKYQYKETIDMHLKDIKPRFERLWNIIKREVQWDFIKDWDSAVKKAFYHIVEKEIENYPSFVQKLRLYFQIKKQKDEEKWKERMKIQQRKDEEIRLINKHHAQLVEAQLEEITSKVIKSQQDLIEVLDKLLRLKKLQDRYTSESNIVYKIYLLSNQLIIFAPQNEIISPSKKGNNLIIRFNNQPATWEMLGKYLAYGSFGFDMKMCKSNYQPRFTNQPIQYNFDLHDPDNFVCSTEDKEKQQRFRKKHSNYAQILYQIDSIFYLNRIRGRKVIKMSNLSEDPTIMEFLDSFRNFFLTNRSNYIYCQKFEDNFFKSRMEKIQLIKN